MHILKILSFFLLFNFITTIALAREVGIVTGLPIPRFVVLKSSDTNLRKGPNVKFPIVWSYKRKGYPMQLVAEFENWRKLRDYDGAEGWIHENLITGARNVMFTANHYKTKKSMYLERNSELILFRYPDENSYPMARIQLGAIGKLRKCQKEWCNIRVENTTGWALKSNLWGVLEKEILD